MIDSTQTLSDLRLLTRTGVSCTSVSRASAFKSSLAIAVAAASLSMAAGANAATWKMALGDAAGGTQYELGKTFASLVEEKSGGDIKVDLFPNGQLGSEQDTVNNASMGLVDLSVVAINNLTPFSPTVGVLTLPYVIHGPDDAKALTQGKIGDELRENTLRDSGIRILGWAYSGCRPATRRRRWSGQSLHHHRCHEVL